MKKTVAAAVLLAALFAAALWNIRWLDTFTDAMVQQVELSRGYCRQGNLSAARAALRDADALWTGAEGYTHVFLRHGEVDAVTDAICDVLIELDGGGPDAAEGAYDRLEAHLRSIDAMEHITVKSVF